LIWENIADFLQSFLGVSSIGLYCLLDPVVDLRHPVSQDYYVLDMNISYFILNWLLIYVRRLFKLGFDGASRIPILYFLPIGWRSLILGHKTIGEK
jgi:hypothetical protein